MQLSERELQLPPTDFARVLRMAAEDKSVISLGPGEPDFPTPKHIRLAMKRALDKEETHYSPLSGRFDLKKTIAKKYKKETKKSVDPATQVMVTNGSTEGLFLSLLSVVDPGEIVLVPDPAFLAYEPMVELLNGYPQSVPLKKEEGFQLTAENIKKSMTDPKRTRAIFINTPSNPTGVVLDKKRLEEIADMAVEYDFLVLCDEAYEKLVYGRKFPRMGSLNGMEDYVLTLQTFSKTYAMPGLRLGYAIGPEDIIESMTRLHLYTSLTAATPTQIAGKTALEGPQGCVKKMVNAYDKRRKFVVKRLTEIPGFELVEPEGAFYAFPEISFKDKRGKRMSSTKFAEFLIKEAKVLGVPGTEFGRHGGGFIRFSYATSLEQIKEAMDRIEAKTSKLGVL